MSPALVVSRLGASLGGRAVLADASFAIAPGEIVALVGRNGAGKTTLLRAVAGLLPSTGVIELAGRPRSAMTRNEAARHLAYLAQGGRVHWPMRVADIVALGRIPFGAGLQALTDADRVAVARAMSACAIEPLAERAADRLSGGEMARVLLARALAVEAPLLLADEPVAALDPGLQIAIMTMLQAEARQGRAVLCVMHDLALALRFCDRLIALREGRVHATGTPAALLASGALDEVFGARFISAEVDGVAMVGVRG